MTTPHAASVLPPAVPDSIPRRGGMRGLVAASVLLTALVTSGCFDAPKLEERWTRVDLVGSNLTPAQAIPSGAAQPITVTATVTYRSILTGFAVADLRASGTLTAADVEVHPNASRLRMAQDIDRILQNSVSVGRATRAVTGWDHLIQRIDFAFTGSVPTAVDSTGAAPTGLFLVCYLGSGQRMERQDGTDSLIVTPFPSTQYELLPIGMALGVAAPVAARR